jgi:hypothetical protein
MNTMRKTGLYVLVAGLVAAVFLFSSCGGGGSSNVGVENGGEGVKAKNNFSFLVCGDPHGRTDLLQEIIGQRREGEFLVIVGDLTSGGSIKEMQKMKDFLDASGTDYYVIPGDNDMPKGDPSSFRAVFGPDYYVRDMQDSHLVFLDNAISGVGCPDEELAWLREDLAAEEGRVVIGFAHVPPGAPVRMENPGDMRWKEEESSREALDILRQAGAPVLYCGHLHVYMLFSSGPPRVVVTGGAGAPPHLSEESGGYHHFLRVTVKGDQASEEVIRLNG